MSTNPSDGVAAPSPDKKDPSFLTLSQFAQLCLSSQGDRFHALWVVLGTLGLRIGEAMGLRWEDVDLTAGTVTISNQLQRIRDGSGLQLRQPKSLASKRTLYLGSEARTALESHRHQWASRLDLLGETLSPHQFVFCTESRTPFDPSRVNKYLDKALAKATLPKIRVHDLRHTAASIALETESLRTVADMLGHSNTSLTLSTYGHIKPAMAREASERVASRLKDAMKDQIAEFGSETAASTRVQPFGKA